MNAAPAIRDSILRRYGSATAIPEELDSAAAPLLHADDPAAAHHAAAPADALSPPPGRSLRLLAAVSIFIGVTALYTAFVSLIRWHLGLPWPWDPARDVSVAATMQTVTLAASLGTEALMQSAWPWACRPLLARDRRRALPACSQSSHEHRVLWTSAWGPKRIGEGVLWLAAAAVQPLLWGQLLGIWLVAAPLHIAAIGSAASLAAVSWAAPGPGHGPGPSERKLTDGLLAIAATQLLVAIAWAAALCFESGQQDPGRASNGGRQLQSSWRAMERLELWTLPAAQFDSIVAAGTAEAALARESEARALSEAASLRREAITAWKQLEERQQALQALEIIQKAAAAENTRLRASLQEWSLANARLERQLQESLLSPPVS